MTPPPRTRTFKTISFRRWGSDRAASIAEVAAAVAAAEAGEDLVGDGAGALGHGVHRVALVDQVDEAAGRERVGRHVRHVEGRRVHRHDADEGDRDGADEGAGPVDRKSTRLNSSHANISYAVFCLKKKTFFFESSVSSVSAALSMSILSIFLF